MRRLAAQPPPPPLTAPRPRRRRSPRGRRASLALLVPLGLLLMILPWLPGCSPSPEASRETITYTFDEQTRGLIDLLAQTQRLPAYQQFDRRFKGLFVPGFMLPYEPFVLGLSTESKVPTVLLLDAPWVRRYAEANWLYEIERTGVFSRTGLVPAIANAFSVPRPALSGGVDKELMAVPTSIKGNILFYRRDLLDRYKLKPPRDWQQLVDICRVILPRERSLKYGLLFHSSNFTNDFYPILWGFGGEILDDAGNLALLQTDQQAAAVAALSQVCALQGVIAPGPAALKELEPPLSLRRAFYRGEALFMINWNTRLQDLKEMLARGEPKGPGGLASLGQVGFAAIPCKPGNPQRFSNVGSFGWGINRFAITHPAVITLAQEFIDLVTDVNFQVLAAKTLGQVPTRQDALKHVQDDEVRRVYQSIFGAPDVVLKARPLSRRINNVLEKYLLDALYGKLTPAAAISGAVAELRRSDRLD